MRKSKRQKMYKMKGCSKKRCYKGGTTLAYTGDPLKFPSNPNLAYTGAGTNTVPPNVVPNQGPPLLQTGAPVGWNGAGPQRGGCGCGLVGGRRTRSKRGNRRARRNLQKGGAFPMDDLVNLARYVPYSIGNLYNGFLGYPPSVNPMPTSQPALQANLTAMKLARV